MFTESSHQNEHFSYLLFFLYDLSFVRNRVRQTDGQLPVAHYVWPSNAYWNWTDSNKYLPI